MVQSGGRVLTYAERGPRPRRAVIPTADPSFFPRRIPPGEKGAKLGRRFYAVLKFGAPNPSKALATRHTFFLGNWNNWVLKVRGKSGLGGSFFARCFSPLGQSIWGRPRGTGLVPPSLPFGQNTQKDLVCRKGARILSTQVQN